MLWRVHDTYPAKDRHVVLAVSLRMTMSHCNSRIIAFGFGVLFNLYCHSFSRNLRSGR